MGAVVARHCCGSPDMLTRLDTEPGRQSMAIDGVVSGRADRTCGELVDRR